MINLDGLTKNDAKCSDVITALKPTTGTKAANKVPRTTCIDKVITSKQVHDHKKENRNLVQKLYSTACKRCRKGVMGCDGNIWRKNKIKC